ncbi:MAG: FAD-dependent oxidoreductase [Acidobacteriota bacterium]
MSNILILGGGFAAISAAETLASAVSDGHEVTLVSKNPDFTFFPAIVPMVFGDFAPEDIRFDLRPKLAERGIKFVQGEVRAINTRLRTVEVSNDRIDSTLTFDYLVMALGPRFVGGLVPGLFEHAHHLVTVDAAMKFKETVAEFKSGSIVVGLCPNATLPVPVCESAVALADRFMSEIGRGDVSVSVVFPSTFEKAFAGSTLIRNLEATFERKGIRLVSDFPVTRVEQGEITSASGGSLKYDLLMLIPPFASQLSLRNLGPVTDFSGFARVNAFMQVPGAERIYAAGDIVSLPGPKFGYMAIRQGKVAALNILAELKGEKPAVEYRHKMEWALAEKYTDPVFFHYGFWDDTLDDFDEDVLLGMAKEIRRHYGPIKRSDVEVGFTATVR